MNYLFIIDNFLNWMEINYTLSLLLFFIFILFYSLFSLPGLLILYVFFGYVFGIFWSYIICLISFTLGCYCFFLISKYILNSFFKKFYEKHTSKIQYIVKDTDLEYLIIFRLIPGPPLLIQNVLLSLLDISSMKFILATSIGVTPIMLFSIFIGHKLNNIINLNNITLKSIFTWDLFLILFFIISFIIIWIIFKKKLSN